MFRCGLDYRRCKFIVPLLILFAIIFDIIAIAAQSGWCEDEDAKSHYSSMWKHCRTLPNFKDWQCESLMENGWAKAVAALMIIGLIILIFVFILATIYMCRFQSETNLYAPSAMLVIVAILQIIALIIYPVNFNDLIYEGDYEYTWAYGFGWGATIICLGISILCCILPKYASRITGDEKIKYLYETD